MTQQELFDRVDEVATLLVNGDPAGKTLMTELVAEAERLRCKTDFRKAVRRQRNVLVAEIKMQEYEAAGRATVFVRGPNQANELIDEIGGHVAAQRRAFVFGGLLVSLSEQESAFGHVVMRDVNGNVILDAEGEPMTEAARTFTAETMTAPHAVNAACDAVALFMMTNSGPLETSLPQGIAPRMAVRWKNQMPAMKGFANYPVWHGGELLFGSGFHEDTKLWLKCDDLDVEPFDTPEDAVEFLRDEWLIDFPFQTQSDFAAALMVPASILMSRTVLADSMGPPMFLITAPSAGTGKSLLASVLIAAILGETSPSMFYPDDEAEREKRVGAAILEGWSALFLDNLKSGSFLGYRDVTLTKLVTDIIYSGRILGVSKNYKGPAGLLPLATGNNVVVDGDMARRTVECRLEAPDGVNLARRKFKHESLVRWTLDNRGKILGALQTILQSKRKMPNVGGFPEWSRNVAHPILGAVGMSSDAFFRPWEEAAEEDAKGVQMKGVGDLLQALAAMPVGGNVQAIEGDWFTAAEAHGFLNGNTKGHLMSGARHDNEPVDVKGLTMILKRNAGSSYTTDAGTFTLKSERLNLGKRTNRRPRPVFRVRRSKSHAPEMPGSKIEQLADVIKKGR